MAFYKHAYLDANLWRRLPEDLIERILARLPLRSFLRFRSVCKKWRDLGKSPFFLALYTDSSPRISWILMLKRVESRLCRVFDRSANRWINLSLAFLPYKATDVAAASESLLCFRTLHLGTFIVCNPVTRQWKELPPMNRIRSKGINVDLVVDLDSRAYKIIVAGSVSDEFDRKTEVFDSLKNSWKITEDLPARAVLRSESALFAGSLYFLTYEPYALISYDVKQGIWSAIAAPLPYGLTFCLIVSIQNSLLLIGGVGCNGISKKICIWQLNLKKLEWVELHYMPELICRKFLATCYHNYEQISCKSEKDLIILSSLTWPETLVYRLKEKYWSWLPRCPEIPAKPSCGFSWFSFHPSLDLEL